MHSFVFGPVPSRRLGFSLGVDIIPRKYCNFDCIYCQVGKSTSKDVKRTKFFEPEIISREVISAAQCAEKVDFITFSGSGEPTLNKNLGTIIKIVKEFLTTPIAVITNSSLLYDEDVRTDLMNADVVLPSLDAASEEMFQRINRPQTNVNLMDILKGLTIFRKHFKGSMWLEIMLLKGMNDTDKELQNLKEIVNDLAPDKIHLNTVTRPPSEKHAYPLSQKELEIVRKFFDNRCEVISSFEKNGVQKQQDEWGGMIIDILKRRSLTIQDIIKVTGASSLQVDNELTAMENKGLIKAYRLGEEVYYAAVDGSRDICSDE
jgi:wyosine [tRNA(Phe)-imidazoG37] synthetase (radical SAM superfamily)